MSAAVTREALAQILDQALQDVTERTAGVRLNQEDHILEDTLKGTDYEIAAYCRSGEDAIEQYAAVKPDLVTMDIIMQGMDGLTPAPGPAGGDRENGKERRTGELLSCPAFSYPPGRRFDLGPGRLEVRRGLW